MKKRIYTTPDIQIYDTTAMRELCIGIHGTVETEEQWARQNNSLIWDEDEEKAADSYGDEISRSPMNIWDDSE